MSLEEGEDVLDQGLIGNGIACGVPPTVLTPF